VNSFTTHKIIDNSIFSSHIPGQISLGQRAAFGYNTSTIMAPSVMVFALCALLVSSSVSAQDISDIQTDVQTVDRHMPKGFPGMYDAFGGQPQRGTQDSGARGGKFAGGHKHGRKGHRGGRRPSAEGGARGFGGDGTKGHGGHNGGAPGAEGNTKLFQ
jgi:hypothetical protein